MGVDMNEVIMLCGAEPRKILLDVLEKKVPAIMSYLSKGKWHTAEVLLANLGADWFDIEILPSKKPRPINIRVDQPVGVSLKYDYGKFVFETRVVTFGPAPDSEGRGRIGLAIPERIEVVQRRSYFRVEVPKSLRVNVAMWRHGREANNRSALPNHYWQGKLIDISAGGAQVALDGAQRPVPKKGQFVGLRFTPMPYERPLMFDAQIRNILPTADKRNICLGLQAVGLEATPEGRGVLKRLCDVVGRYYQINQSSVQQQDIQPINS